MASIGWLNSDYRIFDPIVSMLEPDTLSSHQYFDRWRGSGYLGPEHRLMLAVLQEAVDCFQENIFPHGRKRDELYKNAETWFFSDDQEWLFSFLNLCEILGFDPDYFRSGLLRWKERAISERSKQHQNLIHTKSQAKPRRIRAVGSVTLVKPA